MRGEHSIVRFDDGGGDTGCRVNSKFKLGLLAIVGRQALEEQRTETGASPTTERVEDQEALKGRAII